MSGKRQKLEDLSSDNTEAQAFVRPPIDVKRNRFPYCIVWGPLPCISWFFPFIGHLGIGDSEGRVHDFAGPYYIGVDDFMTGSVYKYLPIEDEELERLLKTGAQKRSVKELWDGAIGSADEDYRQQMHNLCCNNCHHHVASTMTYMGRPMSMLQAWWAVTWKGKYVSCDKVIKTYLPFLLMVTVILLAVLLTR